MNPAHEKGRSVRALGRARFLFNHSVRTYLFGALRMRAQGVASIRRRPMSPRCSMSWPVPAWPPQRLIRNRWREQGREVRQGQWRRPNRREPFGTPSSSTICPGVPAPSVPRSAVARQRRGRRRRRHRPASLFGGNGCKGDCGFPAPPVQEGLHRAGDRPSQAQAESRWLARNLVHQGSAQYRPRRRRGRNRRRRHSPNENPAGEPAGSSVTKPQRGLVFNIYRRGSHFRCSWRPIQHRLPHRVPCCTPRSPGTHPPTAPQPVSKSSPLLH